MKQVLALLQAIKGNKGHTSAYAIIILAGLGSSVDLLLELGELRATEKYQEMTITRLVDQLYECEND